MAEFSPTIDYRRQPERYPYRSGEQGVFQVEPYKSELLPYWQFKDEDAARGARDALLERYRSYRAEEDFVGMDMARKFLQMGFTRAMRYAKYPGGRKYADDGTEREPQQWADAEKRRAAVIFRNAWQEVLADPAYERLKEAHQQRRSAADAPGD
ncbi:MAG: DUF4385 family protein [Bacteroidetes bacterium]|jgi:hypothetical protein|nr:DUF4385 family protein [Bacteroidota bacterium]